MYLQALENLSVLYYYKANNELFLTKVLKGCTCFHLFEKQNSVQGLVHSRMDIQHVTGPLYNAIRHKPKYRLLICGKPSST